MMTETLFLYYGIVILSALLAALDIRSGKQISIWLILLVSVYSLFAGFKYSIGDDFQGYLLHYQHVYDGNEVGTYFEPGFLILNRLLAFFRVPPVFYFVFLNFVFISAVVTIVKKTYPKALPWAVAIFIMMDYGFSLSTNVYRQYFAVSVFLLMLPTLLLKQKYRWVFFICCFFAAQFHTSLYIGVIYIFLVDRRLVKESNRVTWIVVMAFMYIIGDLILPYLMVIFSGFASLIGYGEKVQNAVGEYVVEVRGGGILLKFMMSALAIWYYPLIMKKNQKNRLMLLIFNGFIIGSIMKSLFFRDIVVQRALVPFIVLEYAVLGIIIAFLLQKQHRNLLVPLAVMLVYILLFYLYVDSSINWMSPYIPFTDFYG